MRLLSRFLGPLLARELLRLSRRPVLRLAFASGPTFMLLLLLNEALRGPRELTINEAGDTCFWYVQTSFFTAAVVLALALPLWICPLILRERKGGGVDLLLSTQVSPLEILFGVAGASACISFTVVLSLTPVVSIMTLFGGVSARSISTFVGLLMLESICMTGACLYAATIARGAVTAAILSYLLGGAMWLVATVIASTLMVASAYYDTAFIAVAISFGLALASGVFFAFLAISSAALADPNNRASGEFVYQSGHDKDTALFELRHQWASLRHRVDEATRESFFGLWVFYVLFGVPLFWILRYEDGGSISMLLLPLWLGAQPFIVVAAVTIPLLSYRPGLFDNLLATILDAKQIVNGTLWTIHPMLFRILAGPIALALLWLPSRPSGVAFGSLIGLAWTMEVILVGAMISLVEARLGNRLWGVVAFELLTCAPFLATFLPSAAFDWNWFLGLCLVVALRFRQWRLDRATSVLTYCLTVHYASASMASWVAGRMCGPPNNSAANLSPLRWLTTTLWAPPPASESWPQMLSAPVFAIGLAMAGFLLWRTMVDRFDELSSRTNAMSATPRRSLHLKKGLS